MSEEDYIISEEAQRIIEKTFQNKENLMIDNKTGLMNPYKNTGYSKFLRLN